MRPEEKHTPPPQYLSLGNALVVGGKTNVADIINLKRLTTSLTDGKLADKPLKFINSADKNPLIIVISDALSSPSIVRPQWWRSRCQDLSSTIVI